MIDIDISSVSTTPSDMLGIKLHPLSFTNASEESLFLEINYHRSVLKSEILTLSQGGG